VQSAFNKSLSQKIRHIRMSMKTKSQSLHSTINSDPPPKKARFRVVESTSSRSETTEEDVARHVVELQREWDKAERNASHIKTLLRETRSDRIALLEGDPVVGCWMQGILEKYPCFAECTFAYCTIYMYYHKTLYFSCCSV